MQVQVKFLTIFYQLHLQVSGKNEQRAPIISNHLPSKLSNLLHPSAPDPCDRLVDLNSFTPQLRPVRTSNAFTGFGCDQTFNGARKRTNGRTMKRPDRYQIVYRFNPVLLFHLHSVIYRYLLLLSGMLMRPNNNNVFLKYLQSGEENIII